MQQLGALLTQVRELNRVTENHEQEFNQYADYGAMQTAGNDLRAKVIWLNTSAGAGAPAFAASQVDKVKCLVDPKSLKINDFYGDEAKFVDLLTRANNMRT